MLPETHRSKTSEGEKGATDPTGLSNGNATLAPLNYSSSKDANGSILRVSDYPKRSYSSDHLRKSQPRATKFFQVLTASQNSETVCNGVMHGLEHDPAFSSKKPPHTEHVSLDTAGNRTLNTFQTVGRSIVHPKEAIKSKLTKTTARQLSKTERPYLSQKSDLEFLQAHDNLKHAESTNASIRDGSDKEYETIVDGHRDRLREMETHRESLQAAWTMSRHVRRVRVVPKRRMPLPKAEQFAERNARDKLVSYDWLKWLGYNLLFYTQDFSAQYIDDFDNLPFKIDDCRYHMERLVMASAPWQAWAMRVRSVYRWERPMVTGKWLLIYLVLWYTEHTMGFLYGYIIYIVLQNRYRPTSIESLRDSLQRSLENTGTAYKFGELIDKHGRHNWLEPVTNDIGPYIQLQLGDVANMLEVLSNFYHWKSPRKTFATLFFISSCLAVTIFADMAFCMKIVWFIVGGTFFCCWPIASIYPKYRYLVSPFKWVLWDIPTNAEWSFQYLRRHAQETREELIWQKIGEVHSRELANPTVDRYTEQTKSIPKIQVNGDMSDNSREDSWDDDDDWQSAASTTSVLEAGDLRSFRAYSGSNVGRLVIYSKGVRFIRSIDHSEVWRVPFLEVAEMSKVQGGRLSKLVSSSDQLKIKRVDGMHYNLKNTKDRDEAFNAIIAFSGLQWQSLQTSHGANKTET